MGRRSVAKAFGPSISHCTWRSVGHRVQSGPIVYCALEGGGRFGDRVETWRQRHLAEIHDGPVPFYLIDVPLDLIADRVALIDAIGEQVEARTPPACVVIDTLNRALGGSENKPEDMAKFIRAADDIRIAFDCLVPIIHHCGVERGRPRGHTSLAGADDVQIRIDKDQDGKILATVEHMKDGEAGAVIGSRLERVEVGTDDDGDIATSCVIVAAEVSLNEGGPKLSKACRFALELFRRLIANEGERAPVEAKLADDVRVYHADKFREHFYQSYPADKRDTKKKAFQRAVLDLQEGELITLWREWIWLRDKRDKRDK